MESMEFVGMVRPGRSWGEHAHPGQLVTVRLRNHHPCCGVVDVLDMDAETEEDGRCLHTQAYTTVQDMQAAMQWCDRHICFDPDAVLSRWNDALAESDCPVCFEPLDPLDHDVEHCRQCPQTFHRQCLQAWGGGACPVCRQ
jgi:hypothetical protein